MWPFAAALGRQLEAQATRYIRVMALTFEWDAQAAKNLTTHAASFDEAITVFADPLARLEDDDRHSVFGAAIRTIRHVRRRSAPGRHVH